MAFLIKCPHTAYRTWPHDETNKYLVKLCIAKQTFSGLLVIKCNHFRVVPLLFFLEAGTRLIKMWAPEHFHRGRLSYVPRGAAAEQANGMMGPRQLPQFASRLMDVFIPRVHAVTGVWKSCN